MDGQGASRIRGCWPAVLAAVAIAVTPVLAHAACLPIVCKFSVSGKKGRFLDNQVDDAQLAAADAKLSVKLSGGRSLAEQSANRGQFAGTGLHMPETERALDSMLANLRASWPRRAPPPVSVRIVGSTDFNPSARPDDVIVVPLGVLIRAHSDDEVAWVLAHEFSHIALAHFSREADERRTKSAVSQVMLGLQTAADMSQQRIDTSGQRLTVYRVKDKGAEDFSDQVWARSQDVGLALELLNQRLSRKQEDQADISGVDLIVAAHYSDAGPGDALDEVQQDEKRLAASLATFDQQLADMSKKVGAKSLVKLSNGLSFGSAAKELFEDMGHNLSRMMINKLLDVASTSHRPADVRKKGVYAYLDDAYPNTDFPKKRTAWLDAVRGSKEFQDAQAAVEAHDAAITKLQDPSPQAAMEAQAALEPALATPFSSTPLIANTKAKIYEAVGDLAGADREYGIAEHPPAPLAVPTPPKPRPVAKARGRKGKGRGRRAAAPPPPAPALAPTAPPAAPDIFYVQSSGRLPRPRMAARQDESLSQGIGRDRGGQSPLWGRRPVPARPDHDLRPDPKAQ